MDGKWTWWKAYGVAALIFLYFAVATVWFVSFLITDLFDDAGDFARDVLATGAWVLTMGAGIWWLRTAQRQGRI